MMGFITSALLMSVYPLKENENLQQTLEFKSGALARYAWQQEVSDELSIDEQILLGIWICVKKDENSPTLADTLKNPYEPSRYVLETPFKKVFKTKAQDLCLRLKNIENLKEKKRREQKEIINEIKESIPYPFVDKMAYLYKAHVDKRNVDGNEIKIKNEFAEMLIYYFVRTAILDETTSDSEKNTVDQQFKNLSEHESYGEVIEDLVQKLDQNSYRINEMPEISLEKINKFEECLSHANHQQEVIAAYHNKIKFEIQNRYDQVEEFLSLSKIDNRKYNFLYEIKNKIQEDLDRVNNSYDSEILRQCNKNSRENTYRFFGKALIISIQENSKDLVEKCIESGADVGQKITGYTRSFFQRVKDVFITKGGGRNFFINPERNLVEIADLSGAKEIQGIIQGALNDFSNEAKMKQSILKKQVVELERNPSSKIHVKSAGFKKNNLERKNLVFNFKNKDENVERKKNKKLSAPHLIDDKNPSSSNKIKK